MVRIALALLLLAACTGPGHQSVPVPAQDSAVPAGHARVYLMREDVLAGSRRQVVVSDGGVEIGSLAEDEYLCWDRVARQGAGHLVFHGVDPAQRDVESFFELPAEPGTTSYYVIRIQREDRKPLIEPVSADDGARMVRERKPSARE
jgi:hypothetical protein